MRQYFISYRLAEDIYTGNECVTKIQFKNSIINIHPLEWLKDKMNFQNYTLLFWEKIELEDLNIDQEIDGYFLNCLNED